MGPWSRVRVAKCQMLVTSFFVLLLGLSMATLAALTYFGAHFAVIGGASSNRTPYEAMHRWAFYTTSSLAGLLALGAVLGAAATVREAGGLMAGGFLCFALVFGALVQAAFWGLHNRSQVEDTVLDVYDLVYERAVWNLSGTPRQQLVAIQDTFLCCGKSSPFSLLGDAEASLCRGQQAARQDCLRGIRSFVTMHRNVACTLTGIGLAIMVYAMLLSSFLWFAIRSGDSLDRKGKYTLSRRDLVKDKELASDGIKNEYLVFIPVQDTQFLKLFSSPKSWNRKRSPFLWVPIRVIVEPEEGSREPPASVSRTQLDLPLTP